MKKVLIILAALALAGLTSFTSLAEDTTSFGGDVYSSGSTSKLATDAPRDAFAYGFSTTLAGDVGKDGHAIGFNVDVEGSIGSDLYVAASNATIRGPVGEDLTVSGFNVRLSEKATVGGNARIAAGSTEIDGPISGSLLVAAGTVTLNSTIGENVRIRAGEIQFGPSAKITGTLTYSSPEEIDIPVSVIAPARVRFVPFEKGSWVHDAKDTINESVPSFWPSFAGIVFGFLVTLGFFLVVAAICLAFMPDRVERLSAQAQSRPGTTMLFGFFGLSMLIGLIPASAMTLVGLPFIPVVILLIVVLWLLGYLLGAYSIVTRAWTAFGRASDTTGVKLTILAAMLVALAILNFIPIIGWLINLAVVLLGLGAISISTLRRLLKKFGNLLEPKELDAIANGDSKK